MLFIGTIHEHVLFHGNMFSFTFVKKNYKKKK